MYETPGLSKNGVLPFTTDEVKILNNLYLLLKLKPIKPILHKDNILKHLQTCKIFYFAGHGYSDPMEPSKSCLLLKD